MFFVDIEFLSTKIIKSPVTAVNQIMYKLKDDADQDELEEEVNDKLSYYLKDIIPQEDQLFIKSMREDEESDRQMLLSFFVVFLIGSIIILVIIIHKLIESDQKSVSVFQGLGATKGEIIGSYPILLISTSSSTKP